LPGPLLVQQTKEVLHCPPKEGQPHTVRRIQPNPGDQRGWLEVWQAGQRTVPIVPVTREIAKYLQGLPHVNGEPVHHLPQLLDPAQPNCFGWKGTGRTSKAKLALTQWLEGLCVQGSQPLRIHNEVAEWLPWTPGNSGVQVDGRHRRHRRQVDLPICRYASLWVVMPSRQQDAVPIRRHVPLCRYDDMSLSIIVPKRDVMPT
jgi:hypothetical protein